MLALLAAATAGRAQIIRAAGDTTTISQDLRAAHRTLLSGAPTTTGILMNQVLAISGPHDFSGSGTPKANNYANWLQQYNEYYGAAVSQSGRPTLAAMRQLVNQHATPSQLALVVLAYNYDELKANAVSSGWVRIDSAAGRLYYQAPPVQEEEEGGTGQGVEVNANSPYEQHQLFAVALAGVLPVSGIGTVYVGSDLWQGNIPAPASLTIDFNDGLGPRPVAMN